PSAPSPRLSFHILCSFPGCASHPALPSFPTRTLFRSCPDDSFHLPLRSPYSPGRSQGAHPRRGHVRPTRTLQSADAGASDVLGRDRKSTRLNSSHVSISYAVFCLKKKSQPIHAPAPPA